MKFEKSEKTELFDKYILPERDFIYRLCFKYSKSKDECQECYSEVMFRIFSGIKTYNPQLHIRPWLYAITRRVIKELQLKQARLHEIDYVDIENLSIHPIEVEEVSSHFIGIDNYQKYYSDDILQALNMINPIARNAILLQQSGYKLKEIADELYNTKQIKNNSIESVKTYLRMGKRWLTKLLSKEGLLLSNNKKIKLKNNLKHEYMAKLKSEVDKWISMSNKDYLSFVEDHIMLTALKAAGIAQLPIYKAAQSILESNRIEIHLQPIKTKYK